MRDCDVVMLAVPWDAVGDALPTAGPLDGKVLVTCVSALRPDFSGQTMGMAAPIERSAAEHIAALAPGAHVAVVTGRFPNVALSVLLR